MTVSVLIADDQGLVRAGFRKLLESEEGLRVVAEAADGLEAVALARRLQPDVVLMDIRMPRLDGLEATRRLLDGPTRTRVVMLTTFDLDEYVFDASPPGPAASCSKTPHPSS
jgi:DNA-binding NarL/FixJ family response regulator